MKKDQEVIFQNELQALISEINFYKKVLNSLPADIFILNNDFQTIEWYNKNALPNASSSISNQKINSAPRIDLTKLISKNLYVNCSQNTSSNIFNYYHELTRYIDSSESITVPFETDNNGRQKRTICIDFLSQKRIDENMRSDNLFKITSTQIQIIKLLCKGKSVKEIACSLNRSYHTIDNHKRNIYRKLNIHKNCELVLWAKKENII